MKQPSQNLSLFMEKARRVIFSQQGLLMSIRRSAWFLFQHELNRKDPETGKTYTPRKALANVLRWMDEQAEFLERIKQEPTQVQRRMLQMLVNGKTKKQIAYDLKVTYPYVQKVFERTRLRLGKNTDYEVVALAVEKGWVELNGRGDRKRNKAL